jgi:Flp pilus assembly protein TadG
MPHRKNEKGMVLVLIVILVPVLLAGLGLVIDNGHAYDLKRRLQKAADAGAVAAAQEMRRNNTAGAEAAAIKNAALNGASAPESEVTIIRPPKTGKRAGDPFFFEITVRRKSPLYFMRALFEKDVVVEAKAVAGVTTGTNCLITLNKTASASLLASGTVMADFGVCAVQVNSSSSTAGRTNGGAIVKAATINIVGNYSGTGFTPTPITGASYVNDPLADLAPPTVEKCDFNKEVKVDSPMTLSPGTYCGGLTVTAQGVATVQPGVYIIKSGLTVLGGGTLKGDGVMFYLTQSPYGPVNFAGTSIIQLTAPKSGTYSGILFFGDRTVTLPAGKTNKFAGTADSYLTGALYFPSQSMTFVGTTGMAAQKVMLIADTVEIQGTVTINAPTAADGMSLYTMIASLVY